MYRRRNHGTRSMYMYRGILQRRFHGQPELCAEIGLAHRVSRGGDNWSCDFRVSRDKCSSTACSVSIDNCVDEGGHKASLDSACQVRYISSVLGIPLQKLCTRTTGICSYPEHYTATKVLLPALKGLQLSDLTGNWPFSYDLLALSIRGSQEMKPRHAPRVVSCYLGPCGKSKAASLVRLRK